MTLTSICYVIPVQRDNIAALREAGFVNCSYPCSPKATGSPWTHTHLRPARSLRVPVMPGQIDLEWKEGESLRTLPRVNRWSGLADQLLTDYAEELRSAAIAGVVSDRSRAGERRAFVQPNDRAAREVGGGLHLIR